MARKSSSNIAGVLLIGVGVFIVLNEIKRAKSCGPNCQTLVSDAEETLIEDLADDIFD